MVHKWQEWRRWELWNQHLHQWQQQVYYFKIYLIRILNFCNKFYYSYLIYFDII